MTTPPNLPHKLPILSEHPGRRSPVVPALITLACAALLTCGSSFGVLATCGNNGAKAVTGAFMLGFLGGVVLFCAAAVWLLFLLIWYAVKAFRGLLQ